MFCDIRRLRGSALAAIAVVAGLAFHGLILRTTIGRMGPWFTLRDQTFNVMSSPEKAFKRMLALRRDVDSGFHIGPRERLGLLLGSSTLRQGVDPSILDAETVEGYRWTNLDVTTHPHEVSLVARAVYREGLEPRAMALVTTPGVLVADADREAEAGWYDFEPLARYARGRKVELVRTELVSLTLAPWHLAFPYRGQVFTLFDRQLFLAKLRMFEALGQGLKALSAPEADPWLNPYPADVGPPTDEGNERVLKFIGIKGWYDPASYRVDGPNYAMLLDFFRTAREHGTKTFLVFVPESSTLRSRMPASAADHLKKTLVEALGDAAPVVLDFREAMPDDVFADVNHLNVRGRDLFSHRLAEAMKSSLGAGAGGPSKP